MITEKKLVEIDLLDLRACIYIYSSNFQADKTASMASLPDLSKSPRRYHRIVVANLLELQALGVDAGCRRQTHCCGESRTFEFLRNTFTLQQLAIY